MKHLSILLLAALVAGCASPSTRWVKAGSEPEDLRLDQDECASRGRGYDFALEDRDSGRIGIIDTAPDNRDLRGGGVRSDVYRQCMENRGWRRERGGQPPQ
jgi:hypothetical protein